MKAKKQTQVKLQQERAEALKQEICKLLHWTEEQYCWHQYEQGLNYLRQAVQNDAYAYSQLERDVMFWAWFRLKYMENDNAFIVLLPPSFANIKRLELEYSRLQSGQSIADHNPLERFITARIYKDRKIRKTC